MQATRDLLIPARRTPLIVIAVTVGAIVVALLTSWHNYTQIRDQQTADAETSADKAVVAVDDHVDRLLDYADSYLRELRAYYLEHGNGEEFRRHIAETRIADDQNFIGDIAVVDGAGQVVFVESTPNPPKGAISDLPYFMAFKADPRDRPIIDPTRLGRATHEYQFRVVRPLVVNDRFAGAILITLRPEAIIDLYRQFGLGAHSTISVMQSDEHRFIARLPVANREYFDKRFDSFDLWDRLKDASHGFYRQASPLDGLSRHYAFRKAAGYPIAIAVGVADTDIDANLASERRDIGFQALSFAAAAGIICLLVLRIIRVEDRLRRTNASLLHAQRMGKIGNVEVDLIAMTAFWSDELYRIYDRDPKLGPAQLEEFLASVHPDDRAIASEMRDQHVSGEVGGANEFRIVRNGGEIRWIHREVEVLRDASGKPIKLITTEQDITDRKRLEQTKDAFVSTVSHELRTPLTSIRGALGLIAAGAMGTLPDQAKKLVDVAHRNSERLSRLVNDLLDLQRIDAGRMVYKFADLEITPLVEESIEATRPFANERGVTVAFASTCSGALVNADPDRMAQVMANLLSNAIKFSKTGQTVSVTVERREPWLRIAVEDHGEGIPEAFRGRIFQRFSQADSSDTRKSGGSGLGLSIVHAIVTRHGGEVSFESEPGVGSRFYVDLKEVEASTQTAPLP